MLFGQVKANSTGRTDACVNHGPRLQLHVDGSALREFDPRLPLWVDLASSYIYLMPDPNVGEMGEAAVTNLAPPGCVRWVMRQDHVPFGVDPLEHLVLEPITSAIVTRGGSLVRYDDWTGWSNLRVRL